MKNESWQDIEAALRAAGDDVPVRDADEFWHDFKARLKDDDVRNEPAPAPVLMFPTWMKAVACAGIIVAAVALLSPPETPTVTDAGLSEVKALDVAAAHSAVMIMTDEASQGTIVWVHGMELNLEEEI